MQQIELRKLIIEGLKTDGAHHKQWFLEEILKFISPDDYYLIQGEYEKGLKP